MFRVGVVAIGRNEGERLRRCLESAIAQTAPGAVVCVDSGSTDGSVQMARELGAHVVELDLSTPFTAARARNAGFERLLQERPDVEFVQFVDGDCEIVGGWMGAAAEELQGNAQVAVVAGRRRERHPERSIYNRLCDMEWDTPVGEAKSCGGDALMRVSALRQVGGYDAAVIAGEEPELCVRLRGAGWKIRRIDREMTLHDADMTKVGQWWRRSVRAGHAYAEGAAMHGAGPERHRVRETRSIWGWGLVLPVVAFGLAWPTRGVSLLLLGAYAVLFWRIARHMRRQRGLGARDARLYAASCVAAKFPQLVGQSRYWLGRVSGRRSGLIEYKANPVSGATRPAIAYVASAFPVTSETFVYREVRALRERGWRVHVVSLYPPEPVAARSPELAELAQGELVLYGRFLPATLVAATVETLGHPLRAFATLARAAGDAVRPGESLSLASRLKLLVQVVVALAAARQLRRWRVRHVHCHFAHAPTTIGMYAAGQMGISFSFTGHANDIFQRRALLARKLERAAFAACISEWHRGFYTGIVPGGDGKYVVIRCGVDVSSWQPVDATEPAPGLRVLSVCRLVEKKGIDRLIEALSDMGRRHGRAWQLTVAGDGPVRQDLEALAGRLGCSASIRWLGAVGNDQVRALMADADVFALPCRSDRRGDRDGIPVVLMEAMACGIPVIAGDLPALRELIEDGASGLLVDAADPARLADLLAELHADPRRRAALGAAGRRRVVEEFSLEMNTDRLEQAMHAVLGVACVAAVTSAAQGAVL